MTLDQLVAGLKQGQRRALGRAITLIESIHPKHQAEAHQLMESIMDRTGQSHRIGISGAPGAGKSTFIESLGMELIKKGHKLAVLAVDPSSPLTSGSILGDKTRMQELSAEPNAFIRPSPAGRQLGGVASKTREAVYLCEAAGYDRIIIETVGVGQSEHLVRSMVDHFVYLQIPNSGDQLQGIKKGILELADLILVNKHDGRLKQAAKRSKTDLELALSLIYQHRSEECPEVLLMSALEREGLDRVYSALEALATKPRHGQSLPELRAEQNVQWFREEVQSLVMAQLFAQEQVQQRYSEAQTAVSGSTQSARQAAHQFVSNLNLG